jgi:DNA-binding MarR family transcriptional regulator/N-acetylglutamate synthase-like GNAT family acetyltransferase
MELAMGTDVLADLGPIFLGSRLRRLAERMQAGAARVIEQAGLAVQPTHMPLLAALDRGAMTVGELADAVGSSQPGVTRGIGQLVEMGLVESVRGADQRQRALSLTPAGAAAMARIKLMVWPRVGQAVNGICATLSGSLLDQIAGVEAALAAQPLDQRVAALPHGALRIRDYSDDLAADFHDINAEWISAMFRLEQTDRDVLENPRERIIDPGGAILFVEAPGLGVIGTCALQKTGPGSFELTKMGVRENARGLKAGKYLLAAMIDRAQAMGVETLYLLTNARCTAAIHLYEKLGFRHDVGIMASYGARYERCDVAMRWRG